MSTPSSPLGRDSRLSLRCHDVTGRVETTWVQAEPWPAGQRDAIPTRKLVRADGGGLFTQKGIPPELGTRLPQVYDLLENEARIGVRLARRYAGSYPQELARLVGYALDDEEPYLLFAPFRGRLVADAQTDLMIDKQRLFQVSLLQGVLALAEVEVVHGHLNPTTVRWDDQAVQICDYTLAAMSGEDRTAIPHGLWASSAYRVATGVAHTSDDVWAAGAMIYEMVTGQLFPRRGAPNLTHRGAALRNLLDGVFAASVQARPEAGELLHRLRSEPSVPPAAPVLDPVFFQGMQVFDQITGQKRASLEPPPPPSSPPPPPPPPPTPGDGSPGRWWGGARGGFRTRSR